MRLAALVLVALFSYQVTARAENPLVPTYQKLCDGGDASYCQALGVIFNEGRDVPADKAKAIIAFGRACDGGAEVACRYAADLYAAGDGVTADNAKAAVLYRRACDLHDKDACTKLDQAKTKGSNASVSASVQKKPESATLPAAATAKPTNPAPASRAPSVTQVQPLPTDTKAVMALAERGDAAAQNSIGFRYQNGAGGLPKDADEALKWYMKSAGQNYAPAMNNLCKIHDRTLRIRDGIYTPQGKLITPFPPVEGPRADISAAVMWCKKAFEGNGSAYDELAVLYARGWPGAPPDYVQAYRLISGRISLLGPEFKAAVGQKLTPVQRKAIDDADKTCAGDPKCDPRLRTGR